MRVGAVDPVDLRSLQDGLGLDLQGSLGGGRVGREERRPDPGREDDDATLVEVAHGSQRNVGLGDLAHVDRGLHARWQADLLQGVLQRQRVHHGGQHAHVVGPRPIDAGSLPSSEDVSSPDDDRGLHAEAYDIGELLRDPARGLG